ncbi:DUF2974 domain-containing protein [Bifidobacterium gallicum]|nr:DUF2974 domain-containing protein [Bifidobacterium gallicum]KFI57871.1 cytosolic protein [Bifidobacterium gallicum DSM 20093 = LMG 11596]
MGTVTDYVQTETQDFSVVPFNEVDALVYAMLAYCPIPDEIPTLDELEERYGTLAKRLKQFDWKHPLASTHAIAQVPYNGVKIRDMAQFHPVADGEEAPTTEPSFVPGKVTEAFYRTLAGNPRFSSSELNAAQVRFRTDQATQFAAITYKLPDGTLVIGYRGTDDTLVGWREDFDMSYAYPVPAQRMAADYLRRVAQLWDGPIMLTGHSKGGNLAVYAAMNVEERIQDRIQRIFSMDGPGFPSGVASSKEYAAIVDRITKVMPDSSIIGLLMTMPQREHHIIVKSNVDGIMQHSGFNWLTKGDQFDTVPELSPKSQQFYADMNHWLDTNPPERIERGVAALFRVLEASGHERPSQIATSGLGQIPDMLSEFVGLDSDQRKVIMQVMGMIMGAALSHNPDVNRSAGAE